MNTRKHFAISALLLTALFSTGAFAADPPTRMSLFVDCAHPTLPSQRQVGELLGQWNFSQVYDSRASLLGEMQRACGRNHVESLTLVIDVGNRDQTHTRLVANNSSGKP